MSSGAAILDRRLRVGRERLTKVPRPLNYRSDPLAIIRMDNITVTERAAHKIGEILRREPPGTMLRVRPQAAVRNEARKG